MQLKKIVNEKSVNINILEKSQDSFGKSGSCKTRNEPDFHEMSLLDVLVLRVCALPRAEPGYFVGIVFHRLPCNASTNSCVRLQRSSSQLGARDQLVV